MLTSVITALAVAIAPTPVEVDLDDPEAVFAEAERRWAAGETTAVAELFERAYEVDPQPEYLFGRARAVIKDGDCETGRGLLEVFLTTDPPAVQRDAAQAEADKCAERPSPENKGDDPAAAEPVSPREVGPVEPAAVEPVHVDAPTAPASQVGPRSRRPDALAWSLLGVGAATTLVGAGLFFAGRARTLSPSPAEDEVQYRDQTDGSRRAAWVGVGLGGAGLGLVVAGTIRLGLRRRTGQKRP